jgi:predicted transcriptional regulator of viral defense system
MFHILNGKHTGRLGVIQRSLDDGSSVPLSGKERMLIDIAGRPVYAGGIELLLQVYKAAAEHVSAKRMARLLAQLDYVHNLPGFLILCGLIEDSLVET